jgi:hypothetical protein
VNKEELVYSALEAMKEQDRDIPRPSPKIMMSIETYEQMQRDPEKAKDICNRVLAPTNDPLKKEKDFLKKW